MGDEMRSNNRQKMREWGPLNIKDRTRCANQRGLAAHIYLYFPLIITPELK